MTSHSKRGLVELVRQTWRMLTYCWKRMSWLVWRRQVVFLLIVQALVWMLLLYGAQTWGTQSTGVYRPLQLLAAVLTALDQKLNTSIWGVIVALLIPFGLTLIVRSLLIRTLLPRSTGAYVDALNDRCVEVSEVARKRAEECVTGVAEFVDGLRTGVNLDEKECKVLGRDVIEVSRARHLHTTCLQTPDDLRANMGEFSKVIAGVVEERNIAFSRIVVSENQPDWNDGNANWLKELHQSSGMGLYWMEKQVFRDLASCSLLPEDQLDVMLFDGHVVYTLLNSVHDLKVVKSDMGNFRLFLMDSKEKLSAYRRFFADLYKCSQLVTVCAETSGKAVTP